jgi:hypothetical protein
LLPNILGGPGAVNAGLIATQAIIALDFPLAMAVSAIMMATLLGLLLYIGHRLFDLTRILEPQLSLARMNDYENIWVHRLKWAYMLLIVSR